MSLRYSFADLLRSHSWAASLPQRPLWSEHSISVDRNACFETRCLTMYVVCVLCDVGRRHAVAFRAERRRRHVFVLFFGACACVRVCAVFVCMHVHVCAHTLPPAPIEPGCVTMYVVCVVCAVSNSSHAASSCRGACGRTTMKAFEP